MYNSAFQTKVFILHEEEMNFELRRLVVHVECGWNSEQAVKNIESIVKKLANELHTLVVNFEEMEDLFSFCTQPARDIKIALIANRGKLASNI